MRSTSVTAPGLPEMSLAVRRGPAEDLAPRGARAAARWGLSPRERQVVSFVARGASNKTTAVALRVQEGTVEAHVTHVLHKAQVESRAALAAAIWSMPP